MKARKPSKQQRLNAAKARSHSALTLFHSAIDELETASAVANDVANEAAAEAAALNTLAETAAGQAATSFQQATRLRNFLGEDSE